MDDKQKRFLELSKKYEKLKLDFKEISKELETVMKEIGVDQYFQDPETSLVYKIIQPAGRFVDYKTIDYKRTAKKDERGSTVLSKKEAEEKGFIF